MSSWSQRTAKSHKNAVPDHYDLDTSASNPTEINMFKQKKATRTGGFEPLIVKHILEDDIRLTEQNRFQSL